MSRFQISRKLEIDMAHRVPHHGSKCYKVHGHRYVIEAVCSGPVVADTTGDVQTGMVVDFSFLKAAMTKVIDEPHDHGITLWEKDPLVQTIAADVENPLAWKVFLMPDVPTAENLAALWYRNLNRVIPEYLSVENAAEVKLDYVKVWETPNCYAIYPAAAKLEHFLG